MVYCERFSLAPFSVQKRSGHHRRRVMYSVADFVDRDETHRVVPKEEETSFVDFGCIIYFTGFRVSVPYLHSTVRWSCEFCGFDQSAYITASTTGVRKRGGGMEAGFTTPKVAARRGKTETRWPRRIVCPCNLVRPDSSGAGLLFFRVGKLVTFC